MTIENFKEYFKQCFVNKEIPNNETISKFICLIVPKKKLKVFYENKNINNKIIHIVAEINDEGDYYIVTKQWLKHKLYWYYEIKSLYYYFLLFKDGVLKKE